MPNYNNATIAGHLTRDPELRHVGEKKTALLTFGVAVEKKRGETKTVGFFDCKAWGSTALGASGLKKGDAVIVTGELAFEQWEDKQSGAKRSRVVIQADVVGRPLYQKKEEAPATSTGSAPAPGEDDVPF